MHAVHFLTKTFVDDSFLNTMVDKISKDKNYLPSVVSQAKKVIKFELNTIHK